MAYELFDSIFGKTFPYTMPTARGNPPPDQAAEERGESQNAELAELKSDYERLKRRMESIEQSAKLNGVKEAVLALLPTLDSLDEGIRLGVDYLGFVREQFLKGLWECKVGRLCVERGDELNPDIHNAVGTVETDEVDEGRIVHVVRNGYAFASGSPHGPTIRPALVRTAVHPVRKDSYGNCS